MVTCPEFDGSFIYDGKLRKSSYTLGAGKQFLLGVDTTDLFEQVDFTGSSDLGVLYDEYQMWHNITVPQGSGKT